MTPDLPLPLMLAVLAVVVLLAVLVLVGRARRHAAVCTECGWRARRCTLDRAALASHGHERVAHHRVTLYSRD